MGSQLEGIDIILLPYYSDLHNDSKIPLCHHYTAFIGITSLVAGIGDSSVAEYKKREIGGLKKKLVRKDGSRPSDLCLHRHCEIDQAAS